MIQAYQFIKYNASTRLEHILKVHKTGAIVCFDFEDGICDPLQMESTSAMKAEAREVFKSLYSEISEADEEIRIGLRLNHNQSNEFRRDLASLDRKNLHSIFLPKIENADDVSGVIKELEAHQLTFNEVIPIIETRRAMENLESILQENPAVSSIAFGHCDYNLDVAAYPFFHQDSWEYWKWIKMLAAKSQKYGVGILNSPYLNIYNEEFFYGILRHIKYLERFFCGQITLSTRQSELCAQIEEEKGSLKAKLENKNQTALGKSMALKMVNDFELHNKSKGLSKSTSGFISLQEYLASKNILADLRPTRELCFVGGCFPVQHNIVFEDLFYQSLKVLVEKKYPVNLLVNLVRYERFRNLLDKIKAITELRKQDYLVFHVRPEPFLRLVKLLYKHVDENGKLKWSLNLPYFNIIKPEEIDFFEMGRAYPMFVKKKKSRMHELLVAMNYLLGILIGNKRYALKKYLGSVKEVINYCESKQIQYMVLGPNRRDRFAFEPALCSSLHKHILSRIDQSFYVSGFENNSSRFNNMNGIHVTKAYHDLIASRLFDAMDNSMNITS